LDPMRPVVTNDGWEHTVSDILTIHDYEESGDALYHRFRDKDEFLGTDMNAANGLKRIFAKGFGYQGQPVILSEFGGIAFDSGEGWGYGNKVSDDEAFLKRFASVHEAIQRIPYVVGYCYTQVSDVEQEINGIVRADRSAKVPLESLKRVNELRE
ncbi:MAG: glycoside hydrolase family 2, partial [Desulfobacterales bacterium]|nr:glycoside hydrolase family 2 [Desulfobacterales bacterium]